jgi:peptide subunit release factor 1 (eRF1)
MLQILPIFLIPFLEIDVGTITESFRIVRPKLRQRIGREWTKEHYQSHSQARSHQFINEQIHRLNQVISSGEYKHVILAGEPRAVTQLLHSMPKRLSSMVVSTMRASDKVKTTELVSSTLVVFEEYQEKESLDVVSRLGFEIGTKGTAVKGTQACVHALRNSQARTLVLSQTYDPGTAMSCRSCNEFLFDNSNSSCPKYGQSNLREISLKEEIVRLAEQNRCAIEIVKSSDAMSAFGGVGCLLRYLTPERDDKLAA